MLVCISAHSTKPYPPYIRLRVYSDISPESSNIIMYPTDTTTMSPNAQVCAIFYVVAGNHYAVTADVEKKEAIVVDAWYEMY